MYKVVLLDENQKVIFTAERTESQAYAEELAEDFYLQNLGRRSGEYRRWSVMVKGSKNPIRDYEWND